MLGVAGRPRRTASYEVTPLGLVVLAARRSLPLVVRRRAPVAVLVVVVAAQVGLELAGADGPGWLAAMFAAYTFTSRGPSMTPRRILLVAVGWPSCR